MAYAVQQVYADLICLVFPEQIEKAINVGLCESGLGRDPNTFLLHLRHGGPFQIAYRWQDDGPGIDGWAEFFAVNYGWTWEQVVTNPGIHVAAARVIYDRSGSWAPWPVCGR